MVDAASAGTYALAVCRRSPLCWWVVKCAMQIGQQCLAEQGDERRGPMSEMSRRQQQQAMLVDKLGESLEGGGWQLQARNRGRGAGCRG